MEVPDPEHMSTVPPRRRLRSQHDRVPHGSGFLAADTCGHVGRYADGALGYGLVDSDRSAARMIDAEPDADAVAEIRDHTQ